MSGTKTPPHTTEHQHTTLPHEHTTQHHQHTTPSHQHSTASQEHTTTVHHHTTNQKTTTTSTKDRKIQPQSAPSTSLLHDHTTQKSGETLAQAIPSTTIPYEEIDLKEDLPENYNAPFVNHPTMVATALIAALSFGVIFFFAVTAIVGKRCYDGWQRRHYSRVDYLINGIYN